MRSSSLAIALTSIFVTVMAAFPNRIDTHVHIIPPAYKAAIEKYGDPSGWILPSWNVSAAIDAADSLGVRVQVVSVTAPGPGIAGTGEEGRQLARACNDEVAAIAHEKPGRFAFFGSLPDWNDVDGTLAEIDYVLGTLKAPGIIAMTTYGDTLLGDAKFKPIWAKLDSYSAIVFVHPGAVSISPKLIAGTLPQPIVDYPQATTRTAVDLILTRTFTADSKFKVILSHAGGTTPWLADRISVGSMAAGANFMPPADVLATLKLFYFDVALSTTATSLYGLLQITTPDKILYGSDFPYAMLSEGQRQTARLDENLKKGEFKKLSCLNDKNAETLFGGVDSMLTKMGINATKGKGKL